ncbi:MAG TPA: Sjogren's syndrome/scleroderma autoantigen 1 family protein [Conexivisphaerales archaeon]|nr:Sjogren's syndrome/scleroderma autoantigen 1 family protein [Conexivisphaerales archaeon]
MSETKNRQKLMAEMMRRGATLLQEPCPECGGILLRFKGKDICPSCSGLTSVEELDELEASAPAPAPVTAQPKFKADAVSKVLEESLAHLAKEKDPAKRLKLLQVIKLCAEVLKLLKE